MNDIFKHLLFFRIKLTLLLLFITLYETIGATINNR